MGLDILNFRYLYDLIYLSKALKINHCLLLLCSERLFTYKKNNSIGQYLNLQVRIFKNCDRLAKKKKRTAIAALLVLQLWSGCMYIEVLAHTFSAVHSLKQNKRKIN